MADACAVLTDHRVRWYEMVPGDTEHHLPGFNVINKWGDLYYVPFVLFLSHNRCCIYSQAHVRALPSHKHRQRKRRSIGRVSPLHCQPFALPT